MDRCSTSVESSQINQIREKKTAEKESAERRSKGAKREKSRETLCFSNGGSPVQEMCVSRPLVMRGIFARKRENGQQNAKTRKPRKRENGQQNAKTAKTRMEVQERESWTAMIISGSSGTSMQNNYIALQ